MEIISCEDAKAKGLKRYFSGQPCVNGHLDERYVSGRHCISCSKDRFARRRKERYASDPEYRKKHAKEVREYAKRNAEQRLAYSRKYRAENLGRVRGAMRLHREKNIDLYRSYTRNRRARIAGSNEAHDASDIRKLFFLQRGRCANCHCNLKQFEVDHVHPLSRGGGNGPANLQLLCRPCNRRKSCKDPYAWAKEQSRLW